MPHESILVTCPHCKTDNQVQVDAMLEPCINCGMTAWEIKLDEKEQIISEIEAAFNKLDSVIGRSMYGNLDPKETLDWIEYEAGVIANTLDKAREYIKKMDVNS